MALSVYFKSVRPVMYVVPSEVVEPLPMLLRAYWSQLAMTAMGPVSAACAASAAYIEFRPVRCSIVLA